MLACRNWHKNTAAALLGGLQTDPQFHANGIRLDWLLKLVLSKANGRHKPTRYDLSRVLNAGLEKAGVLRLEDPNEDLFCELIVSERGNFRIFSGQWESAATAANRTSGAESGIRPNRLSASRRSGSRSRPAPKSSAWLTWQATPRCAASARASWTSQLLPMPGSPRT